jgi:hypothetical protein
LRAHSFAPSQYETCTVSALHNAANNRDFVVTVASPPWQQPETVLLGHSMSQDSGARKKAVSSEFDFREQGYLRLQPRVRRIPLVSPAKVAATSSCPQTVLVMVHRHAQKRVLSYYTPDWPPSLLFLVSKISFRSDQALKYPQRLFAAQARTPMMIMNAYYIGQTDGHNSLLN